MAKPVSNVSDNVETTHPSEKAVSSVSDNVKLFHPSKPHVITDTPIGEELKNMRKARGLSQKELSQKVGITTAEICRIEKNPAIRPSRKSLKMLSPFLGKSYTSLLIRAGYSGTIPLEDEFFLLDGESISPRQIGEDIYQIDPELLALLKDLSLYATKENLDLLKILLLTMKWESYQNFDKMFPDKQLGIAVILNSFQHLKHFVSSFLSPLKALLD